MKNEHRIILWIQSKFRNHLLDKFWYLITCFGQSWIWAIICLLYLLIPNTRKLGLKAITVFGLEVLFVHVLLKKWSNRLRPFEVNDEIIPIGRIPKDRSFPSGHTCISFSIAILTLQYLPVLGIIMFILGCLIGFSRMYLGVHYLSDVIGGILLSFIINGLALYLF